MPTLQDDKLDPEQREYEQNFDFERHARELQQTSSSAPDNTAERASMDRADAWKRDNRNVAEREAAPSWDTNVSNGGAGGEGRGGVGKALRRFNPINMAKKRVTQWAAVGIITSVVGLGAAVPTVLANAFINFKELTSDWANRNNQSYFSKRTLKYMNKKLFQADDSCTGGVKCRYKTGVSDKEIAKMKEAGLNPEVEENGKKKFIKSFQTTDIEGKSVRITSANFGEHYGNNVKFRAQMDEIAKPKSMLLRGKQTLKLVFNKFGIKRNASIEGDTDRERNKSMRKQNITQSDVQKANAPPDGGTEEENSKTGAVDESISEAAAQEKQLLESSDYDRPPSIVPDTSNLDLAPDKAAEVAGGLIKGGVKGAVLGVFSAIDKACSGYQLIRAVIFGAKIYKVIGLIKYAGLFMVIADKMKAGDSKTGEVGYLAGLLFRPSSKDESLGKTFFQSEGWNLIFQGKIADHRGLARFTTGTSFLKFMQGAKNAFETVGANKETCKHVQSWYGQTFLVVAGLTTSVFSLGVLAVSGAFQGAALGMIVSILMAYVTPLLIQYAAGTVAPDPTDAEGGYGAGNAIGAAMGGLGRFAGMGNGGRMLTKADAATVGMEANKEMAFEKQVDNLGKSPFSLDSSDSIPSRLALTLAPIAASPLSQSTAQSIASIITSPLSLFSSSFGSILTPGASAQSDIDRGGDFCADDDYRAMDLAVDAWCNPIVGEKASTINDARYDPEKVLAYMLDNGHIDDDGNAKSDDYNKYIASCVDSVIPPSPDGGGAEVGEDVDTRWCVSSDDKFNMFRFYTADSAIDSAHEDSVNGTLGQDTSEEAQTDLNGQTFPNGRIPDDALCELGSQWPGQKLRCDAAEGFAQLAAAYKEGTGKTIQLTDSYRTYEQQVQCRAEKGDLCADPGTSNHGCGQAIDFSGGIQNGPGDPAYDWMKAHAAAYGWIHPSWAEPSGSKPEPWHWEYGTGGGINNGTCQT